MPRKGMTTFDRTHNFCRFRVVPGRVDERLPSRFTGRREKTFIFADTYICFKLFLKWEKFIFILFA